MKNRRRVLGLVVAGFAGAILAGRRTGGSCSTCPPILLAPLGGAGCEPNGGGGDAPPVGGQSAKPHSRSTQRPPGSAKRGVLWTGALVALLVGAVGCHPKPAASATDSGTALPTMEVRVAAVSPGKRQSVEEVVGTVRARRRSVIEAKVSGTIALVTVMPGRAVKAGEVLIELDAKEVVARMEQARAVLQQAERELTRFSSLLKQEAVTKAEFDAVESRQRVAKAALAEAETLGGYTRVTAPFDGVVTRKLADVGDLAGPGRGLLEIEDPASVRLEADVPLQLVDRVHVGDLLLVTVVGTSERTLETSVSEIEPTADAASRTFRMKLDLPANSGARAGAFGRVSVPIAESDVLRVPAAAVEVRGQMELAFVVDQNHARLRLVKTGKRSGTEVEVLSGLESGERVVVERPGKLVDGQPVVAR